VRALEEVMKGDKQILLVAQKNAGEDDPGPDDIYNVGTVATVLQLLKLPDGTVKVLVEGKSRARITKLVENRLLRGRSRFDRRRAGGDPSESRRCMRAVVEQFEQLREAEQEDPPEVLGSVTRSTTVQAGRHGRSHLAVKIADKQELLETDPSPSGWRRSRP
jgi:ATP-dependent Lon protease